MSAKSTAKKTTFKIDQRIVYPLQGVGQIQELVEMPFKGETILYYVIYIPVSDMTVKVPVDRAEQLGIRAIVPRTESERALEMFSEDFEPIPADWKMRYQMNLDLLKQGSILDIASVVRTLYQRKKVKELPIMERKLYDSALQLLVDEISFSLGISTDEVEEMVFSKLEAGSGSNGTPLEDIISDEDEEAEAEAEPATLNGGGEDEDEDEDD
ncbi:MAG: CarD family transcriptional regulator [Spirochaetaceae bacterium]|nr:MAG: CarD family transcriptional regulator [Spirochaetaceae bacterium]